MNRTTALPEPTKSDVADVVRRSLQFTWNRRRYDQPAIVDELIRTHGVQCADRLSDAEYWPIVDRHYRTSRRG